MLENTENMAVYSVNTAVYSVNLTEIWKIRFLLFQISSDVNSAKFWPYFTEFDRILKNTTDTVGSVFFWCVVYVNPGVPPFGKYTCMYA